MGTVERRSRALSTSRDLLTRRRSRVLDINLQQTGVQAAVIAVYDTLLEPEPGYLAPPSGDVRGGLAESWEFPDPTTVVLHLREGVKWDPRPPTNSRVLDSEDVLMTWDSFKEQNTYRKDFNAELNPFAPISSMDAPDAQTVVINMPRPNSLVLPRLASLSSASFNITPKEAFGTGSNSFDIRQEARGTGAMLLERWEPDVEMIYRRNPNYWRENRPFVDAMIAMPALMILITILGVARRTDANLILAMVIALGVLRIAPLTRVYRSAVLEIRNRQFVEAAETTGAGPIRVMLRHILPNIMPLIIVTSTIALPAMILAEASLSFLGFGPSGETSWGQMLATDGRQYFRQQPGLVVYPGLAIFLAVFGFNILGDALRDVLDPRLRGSEER